MHVIGHDATFVAQDCVCRHGVRSPAAAGEYDRACVSVILAGAFHARSSVGDVVVGPGALLLGNAATAYEFRHVDDGGDRSVVFDYDDALLDEIARSLDVPLRGSRWFRRGAVPASPATTEAAVLAHHALCSADPEALREASLTAAMVGLATDRDPAPRPPSPAYARRVAQMLRYIEAHSARDCSLAALAAQAGLSRCYFLRIFHAMTGQTPRQHVIATRLRAAATELRTTRKRVTDVALDTGFEDLSHFTTSFSLAFGASPRAYRKRASL